MWSMWRCRLVPDPWGGEGQVATETTLLHCEDLKVRVGPSAGLCVVIAEECMHACMGHVL